MILHFTASFLAGALGGAAAMLGVIYLAWHLRKKRYGALQSNLAHTKSIRVRYCSPQRYRKWIKFFPWEGTGHIVNDEHGVRLIGLSNSHQPLELDLTGLPVENIGRPDFFRNGLLPWLRVGGSKPVIYFCVETGPFISGAARLNESLLRLIQDGQATDRS